MTHILIATISYDRDQGGGGVRLAYDLAQGLIQHGHQVSVVCEDLYGHGVEREVVDGVTILRYCLALAGVVPFRRHENHIAAATEVMEKYLPGPPQVVHGHSLFQYVATLRRYRGQARFCYTIHSPFVDELRITWAAQGIVGRLKCLLGLSIIRQLELESLKGSAVLVAESEYTRHLIRRAYGTELSERIVTIPGWVDLERFRPLAAAEVEAVRKKLGWPSDRRVFFVLRRLEARMGLDNLLFALDIVRRRGYKAHTVIGGGGSQLSRLLELREKLGLEREITFMGFVPGDLLPLAYGACDASVVPTAYLECFGLIAIEALACGRPALVTPVGALPEVVSQFEPQWIARSHMPTDLADLLCAYLDDKLPSHDAAMLRDILLRRFSFAKALEEYERLLLS